MLIVHLDNIKKVVSENQWEQSRGYTVDIHQTMADILKEEEDRSKLLYHLKEAENILKGMKRSEDDEGTLGEIQAKILILDIE